EADLARDRLQRLDQERDRPHRFFHAESVLAQRIGLGELVQQRKSLRAGLHPFVASAICSRAARAAGRRPPSSPMRTAKMVALTAIAGSKWNLNLISVKDPKFVVVNVVAPRSEASTHPATDPSNARIRLSVRKLPSTDRRRNPIARSVPTSRTRFATCAYMVIMAPSVAPRAKKIAMTVPSTWMNVAMGPAASS